MDVKKFRKQAGMTQQELAKKMNVHQSAVSQWESGKTAPLKKTWKKLAKVLGVTVDELVREE